MTRSGDGGDTEREEPRPRGQRGRGPRGEWGRPRRGGAQEVWAQAGGGQAAR